MKQFEIFLVNLDPTLGSEIKKSRPAVIISPDAMNKMLNTVIVATLTATVKGYPSRVPSFLNSQKGEIVLDQIRTVDKIRLGKKIGKTDSRTSQNIKLVLHAMFS